MIKIVLAFTFSFFCLLVYPQSVDFTFKSDNGLFCVPATIQFTQTSTGNPTGFSWTLGNGLKSSIANPTTSYSYAGTYTVRLTAFYPQGPLEITKTIVIPNEVKPVIVADKNFLCQPGQVNFSVAPGNSIVNYEWDFGDGSGKVNTTGNGVSHTFSNYGNYSIIVKATNAISCSGSDTVDINVTKLPITGNVSSTSGCLPSTTSFVSSVVAPPGDVINNYSWDFGDGTPLVTSTDSTTNHVYTTVDSVLPKLQVTTLAGCTNTYDFAPLAFGTPPVNISAYAVRPTICGSETPSFVANSSDGNEFIWNFGDNLADTTTDTIITHRFNAIRTFNVTVTAVLNGCRGDSAKFPVRVQGVIAAYNYRNTCSDKKTFAFNEFSQGQRTVLWDFGDGSPTATVRNISHSFPPSGAFVTTLVVTDVNSACTDTLRNTIYTATPKLINADTSVCINTKTTFSVTGTYSSPSLIHRWFIAGNERNTGKDSSVTIDANVLGNFTNNYVVVTNGNFFLYCYDTVRIPTNLLVRGPQLDFTVPSNVCFNDTVNIMNNSRAYLAADSVKLWYWNYGTSRENDTTYQPGPLVSGVNERYRIKLVGIDINGCKDSLTKIITVNKLPFLQVSPKADTLCAGDKALLSAIHSDNILWSPATGLSCTTCDTTVASPVTTTQYKVTSTNANNCSISDSILITVNEPFSVPSPVINRSICLNDTVTLDANPKDKVITWSPTAGLSNPSIYNAVVIPAGPTAYTATLTDSVGCFSKTVVVNVAIKPSPTVDAGPDQVVGANSNFTIAPIYGNNVSAYLWTPPDGLNCLTCAVTNGIAATTRTYTIEVSSDSGCTAKDSVTIAIECRLANLFMPTAFTPNGDGLNDVFYPRTKGIKTILRLTVYNREGQVLFEARNFPPDIKSFGWGGDFKGKRQPPRSYVYLLEALCYGDEKLVQRGNIVLLR